MRKNLSIILIVALSIVVVMLVPFPVTYSKTEPYLKTETYTESVPRVVNSPVSVPTQVVKEMKWKVEWRLLTIDRQWYPNALGTETFPATFDKNWGNAPLYSTYDDGVGFSGTASFHLNQTGTYTFTIGSDDGSKLLVDGQVKIDLWWDHWYMERSVTLGLSAGDHTLTLYYYDWTGGARVFFNVVPLGLTMWTETQQKSYTTQTVVYDQVTKERTVVAYRTVTQTEYMSLLELLARGGRVP